MLFLHRESPKKIYYLIIIVNVPGKICLRPSSYLQRNGAFCVWIKSVKNDFSIELTETAISS